jgi:hypothetical protein
VLVSGPFDREAGRHMTTVPAASRLIGALFLAGFLVYGTGSFLMIATTAVDIGKAVLFSRSSSATAGAPRWPTWPRWCSRWR